MAPGSLETVQTGEALRPSPFQRVFGALGAAQLPKMTDLKEAHRGADGGKKYTSCARSSSHAHRP